MINGLVFHQKITDMSPIISKKIRSLNMGSLFWLRQIFWCCMQTPENCRKIVHISSKSLKRSTFLIPKWHLKVGNGFWGLGSTSLSNPNPPGFQLALRVRAVFHKTVRVCHVYCNFKIGFTCRITVIFGTLKDGSLLINTLASNICFSYRNMFQNGVDALSKIVDAFLSKSSKFYLVRIIR